MAKINGIPVDSQETEERCSQCRKNLTIKIYLNLQTKERIFAVTCTHCKTEPVEINRFSEKENSSKLKLKEVMPKKQTFITGDPYKNRNK